MGYVVARAQRGMDNCQDVPDEIFGTFRARQAAVNWANKQTKLMNPPWNAGVPHSRHQAEEYGTCECVRCLPNEGCHADCDGDCSGGVSFIVFKVRSVRGGPQDHYFDD